MYLFNRGDELYANDPYGSQFESQDIFSHMSVEFNIAVCFYFIPRYREYTRESMQKAVRLVLDDRRTQKDISALFKIPRTTLHDHIMRTINMNDEYAHLRGLFNLKKMPQENSESKSKFFLFG